MFKNKLFMGTALCFLLSSAPAFAEDALTLEERIKRLETAPPAPAPKAGPAAFNPAISVVLDGQYGYFRQDAVNIPGFQTGDEGLRSGKGFSLGESEINFSANADHKFYGALTLSADEDKIEIEEAYVKTLDLPFGLAVTAGRLLPSFGYLNEKHKHTDDFADRPLPYRAYLDGGFSGDGVQLSLLPPTDFYSEIGGGVFRGRGFPSNYEGNSPGLITAYARAGGDFGAGHDWRFGASYLRAKNNGEGREAGGLVFEGDDDLYGVDLRYVYSPGGNNRETEFSLQAEYLFRNEKGGYQDTASSVSADADAKTSGFYAQAVYKFMRKYRAGYRYAFLKTPSTPAGFEDTSLDAGGHNPQTHTLMAEYNTSEFGRVRLQYNYDKTRAKADNQFIMQYIITVGAHGAHGF